MRGVCMVAGQAYAIAVVSLLYLAPSLFSTLPSIKLPKLSKAGLLLLWVGHCCGIMGILAFTHPFTHHTDRMVTDMCWTCVKHKTRSMRGPGGALGVAAGFARGMLLLCLTDSRL